MNTNKISWTTFLYLQLILSLTVTRPLSGQELWTVLSEGGKGNVGTIAHYDPSSSFQTNFSFTAPYPGTNPYSGLTEVNNKFYGVTESGGANNEGVLYELDPLTKVYTKLHDFESATGSTPHGPLQALGNKLYGTTSGGGAYRQGGIFEWDLTTNTYRQNFHFYYAIGTNSTGSLTYYKGDFYGATSTGGIYNRGVLFRWNPVTNAYTKMLDRTNEMGGRIEGGGLALFNEKFYGVTWGGGTHDAGIIFEWNPNTNEYFEKIDNELINGGLFASTMTLYNGKFYGNTYGGGQLAAGVIFEWDPVTNIFTKKIDLNYQQGHHPFFSPLTFINNKAYGVMMGGGVYNLGVLYEWDPATNIFTPKVGYDPGKGAQPIGALIFKDGLAYGVATYGGAANSGTIFSWNMSTGKFSKLADFNGSVLGRNPRGSLIYLNNKFYGTAFSGGNKDVGVLFEWDPATNTYRKKIDFNNKIGSHPQGTLVGYNEKYYGVAEQGGAYDFGTIFEWDPTSNLITKKVEFFSIFGRNPTGLTYNNGKFYGVTTYGGAYDQGLLFEWNPATNVLTSKVDFNNTNGANPQGTLVSVNGHLYGVTSAGGDNSGGVLFEFNPANNSLIKRINFPSAYSPQAITYANNKFYGVTEFGGVNNGGIIFEWTINSTSYIKKFDFNTSSGSSPKNALTYSNGKLYGLTYSGGSNNYGVMFEWNPLTNQFKKLVDFSAATGGRPVYSKILDVLNVALPSIHITTPADGATGQKIKLDVIAKPIKGATTYTIQLSTMIDFSNNVLTKSGANKQNFDSLRYNTVYYARAKTDLDPRFGKVTKFKTVGPEYYSFVVSPPDMATGIRTSTFISSNLVKFATRYTIQISEARDFSSVTFSKTRDTRTIYFAGLKSNTKYYARVRTNLSSLWGLVSSFTTQGSATARIQVDTLEISSEPEAITFYIQAFPNPFKDQIQVYIGAEKDQQADITLMDLMGRRILQMEKPTNTLIVIDDPGSCDLCFLHVHVGNLTKTVRVVKSK